MPNNNNNTESSSSSSSSSSRTTERYTHYWDSLLLEEYRVATSEWKERRRRCSPQSLEQRGLAILQAFAIPDSEVLGEKTVRIHNGQENMGEYNRSRNRYYRPWKELFGKGDVLEMSTLSSSSSSSQQSFRKECLVMDVGENWMIVSVGKSWPSGLWESRKGNSGRNGKSSFGRSSSNSNDQSSSSSSYGLPIRLDKTPNGAALIPLRAQRKALQQIREGKGGAIAEWFSTTMLDLPTTITRSGSSSRRSTTTTTTTKNNNNNNNTRKRKRKRKRKWWATQIPHHFEVRVDDSEDNNKSRRIKVALEKATERIIMKYTGNQKRRTKKKRSCYLSPNQSQKDAITYALSRRVSSIQGPPGTGKTRVAALLIATALDYHAHHQNYATATNQDPFRVLGVAHSNGAADVLLDALLELGIPAIRYGRPAIVSSNVKHRTTIALAEKMPQVLALRREQQLMLREERDRESSNNNNNNHNRRNIEWELQHCIEEAQDLLLQTAPVIITSCIGAYQLSVRQQQDNNNNGIDNKNNNKEDTSTLRSQSQSKARPLFSLVVVDEAAQCTEPGLLCALVASKTEQVVLVGDTKQLPPTVASSSQEIRQQLGISPMDRLEKENWLAAPLDNDTNKEQQQQSQSHTNNNNNQKNKARSTTLQVQYRMRPALMTFPSNYFYNGIVTSIQESSLSSSMTTSTTTTTTTTTTSPKYSPSTIPSLPPPILPPAGFKWPVSTVPLAFISIGAGSAEVIHRDDNEGMNSRSSSSSRSSNNNGGRTGASSSVSSSLSCSGRSNPMEAKRIAQIVINLLVVAARTETETEIETETETETETGGECNNPTNTNTMNEDVVTAAQICILTPYSKQVQVIRSTLQQEALLLRQRTSKKPLSSSSSSMTNTTSMSFIDSKSATTSSSATSTSSISTISSNIIKAIMNDEIRIGTIDSFQGQECDIVLFSAVRSNSYQELGFVRDPRRLCVALTRARKGLIVVGDATTLQHSRDWKAFINYCHSQHCVINDDDNDNDNDNNNVDNDNDNDNDTDHSRDKRAASVLLDPDDEFLGLFSSSS